MKRVIAACIEEILEFKNSEEAAEHVEKLRYSDEDFIVLDREDVDGKCIIKIRRRYKKFPMICNV